MNNLSCDIKGKKGMISKDQFLEHILRTCLCHLRIRQINMLPSKRANRLNSYNNHKSWWVTLNKTHRTPFDFSDRIRKMLKKCEEAILNSVNKHLFNSYLRANFYSKSLKFFSHGPKLKTSRFGFASLT